MTRPIDIDPRPGAGSSSDGRLQACIDVVAAVGIVPVRVVAREYDTQACGGWANPVTKSSGRSTRDAASYIESGSQSQLEARAAAEVESDRSGPDVSA